MPRTSTTPVIEPLEPRLLLSAGPTGMEQEMLELINRMRGDPAAELELLVNDFDPISSPFSDIDNALRFFP